MLPRSILGKTRSTFLGAVGLFLIAVISLTPLLLEPRPVDWIASYQSTFAQWSTKAAVILVMVLILGLRAWLDRRQESAAVLLTLAFAILAGVTGVHWFRVDSVPGNMDEFQSRIYLGIFNGKPSAGQIHLILQNIGAQAVVPAGVPLGSLTQAAAAVGVAEADVFA